MNKKRKAVVCHLLASGPTPLRRIHQLGCFLKQDGTRVSWKVFRRGIRKLAEEEYIEIIDCGDASEEYGPEAAVLLERGANFLCTNRNLDPESFRMTIPKPANITHELRLTEIVNTIKRGEQQELYSIKKCLDDTQIRKLNKLSKKSLKSKALPDLDLTIVARLRRGDNIDSVVKRYFLEYDNGNKGPGYWGWKIKSWEEHDAILIGSDEKRCTLLAEHIQGISLHTGGVCIISLNEFMRVGLLYCAMPLLTMTKCIFDPKERTWLKVK